MHIEIKDLQTGEEHRIDEDGTTIGRDGNRAKLVVGESGVSGLHAKIVFRDGGWWVEDQKSSNGTFVDKNRMREPFQLEQGMTFKLHTYGFEVVNIEEQPDGGQTAISNAETRVKASVPPPAKAPEAAKKTSGPLKPAQEPEPEEEAPPPDEEMDDPKSEPVSSPFDKSGKVAAARDEVKGGVASGQVAEQARQAMTYYFAAVPKLAMMPRPTVDESIANQKFPAMQPMELIAWAIPALLLGQLVSVFVGLASMIRFGQFAPVPFVTSFVIGVVVSIVAAVVCGFIFHPVLKWLVNILKGESDEKSRSNYFVLVMTSTSLTTIVGGLGGLFALIPLPFVFVVPQILSLGATLIAMYAFHQWFAHFRVVKWWLTLIKVLAALAALGAVWGIINSFRGPATIGGAGTTAATADAIAAAQKAAEQAAKAGANAGDAAKLAEKAVAEGAKAADAAAKNAGADSAKATEQAVKAATAAGNETATRAAEEAAAAAAQAQQAKAQAEKAEAVATAAAAVKTPKGSAAKAGTPSGDYETYVQKRDAVEHAISKNPTVLTKIDGVLPLYKQLHKEMDAVKNKYKKTDKDDVVGQRLKEADMFDRTASLVDALHAKLLE